MEKSKRKATGRSPGVYIGVDMGSKRLKRWRYRKYKVGAGDKTLELNMRGTVP